MGRARARRLLWGAAVVLAVLTPATAGSASSPGTTVTQGAVQADGTPENLPAGWTVSHPAPGRYRVLAPAHRLDLDVVRWDAVADVVIEPMGAGGAEVRFLDGDTAVDTAFSFTATAGR